jgi:hypothetical protein
MCVLYQKHENEEFSVIPPIKNDIVELFTSADAWNGGHYELAMDLGPHSDARTIEALRRLWTYPLLEGCYLHRDQAPKSQSRIIPSQHFDEKLYGIATLENTKVPCGSFLCRFEDRSDWLEFYLPLASLERIYPIEGYPFKEGADYHDWQRKLDPWLTGIAKHVFQEIPFLIALIGFEVEITRISSETVLSAGVPKVRSEGILLPKDKALEWYPPTS